MTNLSRDHLGTPILAVCPDLSSVLSLFDRYFDAVVRASTNQVDLIEASLSGLFGLLGSLGQEGSLCHTLLIYPD